MSNAKVSQLERISGSNIDINDDLIPITDVSENSVKRSKSITISEITKTAITGSNNFIPMFSGSNKLINSKMSYDRFGDNTTVDSYLTVNKNSIFQNGVFLTSPTNLYDCYLILGNDKVLFPSDSGEGLVLTSVHNDDSMLTLKGWNNTTTLTLDETEIRTNKDFKVQGSLHVRDTLYINELYTQYQTSSVIYSSGSTKFGNTFDDKHEFTGSIYVQGRGTITNDLILNSSLRVDDEANFYGLFTSYGLSIFDNQVQFNNDISVTGNSYLNGNISLNGETTFNNNIYINSELTQNNLSTFNNDIILNGTLQSLNITSSNLTVNGNVTGSAFNKYATTSSLNTFSGSLNSVSSNLTLISSSLENHINSHTHTSFNNNLKVTGSLIVSGGNFTVNNNALFVSSSGNVGLGTASPLVPLHIISTQASPMIVESSNNSFVGFQQKATSNNAKPYVELYNSSNNKYWGIISDPQLDTFSIYNTAGATQRLTINNSGNVGIGTTTPSTKLDVSGSFRLNLRTISSSVQNGNPGEFCFDSNFAYYCTAPNTWKSHSLS